MNTVENKRGEFLLVALSVCESEHDALELTQDTTITQIYTHTTYRPLYLQA